MNYLSLNGKIQPADEPALFASNRSYRYGDGLFETMKWRKGKILLESYHFQRLFAGLSLLEFELPSFFDEEKLKKEILKVCLKNNCPENARIRLSVFRGNGGLYDEDKTPAYLVETWPLPENTGQLNENGLVIGSYHAITKSTGVFSNLKSANFLPYTMAAIHAKKQRFNDCLVLNNEGRIADSTIANLFIIKDSVILTPALTEGPVNGVMRRYLLEQLIANGYTIQETALSENDILAADEVFLTNAVKGIRWVKGFRGKIYTNLQTTVIYERFIKTIFA